MARRPLAVCAASLFALAAPEALATTYYVTSCMDDGSPGTLRSAIASAVNDGDVVDFANLTTGDPDCSTSTITLMTGGSNIGILHDITILGDPNHTWTIDGSQLDSSLVNSSNVFRHYGGGTLAVEYLKITGGHESSNYAYSKGGCIYSNGGLFLVASEVTGCSAYSVHYAAKGGAIYAKNGAVVAASYIHGNTANSGISALGGGVFSGNNLQLKYGSTVTANTAEAPVTAKGGGIYAVGAVTSSYPAPTMSYGQNTTVVGLNYAHATASGGVASGGGIYAKSNVSLAEAVVKYNSAAGGSSTYGGGIRTTGDVTLSYTTVDHNAAGSGNGGGIHTTGNVTLTSSTISNNAAAYFGGIDAFTVSPNGKTFMLSNSTISGNSASGGTGAAYSNLQANKFYDSTIAFNTAGSFDGMVVSGNAGGVKSVLLQGTLMSNNTHGSSENDFYLVNPGNVVFDIASSHNLVRATFSSIPGNTTGFCPLLGPLRDNGGLTKTHALLSHSPAIDNGNDVLAVGYDQRGQASVNGTLDYLRPSGGADTMPDIGAYEVQKSDIVFNTSFETCVPLF